MSSFPELSTRRASPAFAALGAFLLLVSLHCGETSSSPLDEPAAPGRSGWQLQDLESKVSVRLQAVSSPAPEVVWASGLEGTYVRSLDGGSSWTPGLVEAARDLEFRDVHAASSEDAVLLAAGPGEASRIYRTRDGGHTWKEVYRNVDPRGFYNCLAFDRYGRGFLVGDAIDGHLPLLWSPNGATWQLLPESSRPTVAEGEAGFSASGTCIAVSESGDAPLTLLLGVGGTGEAAVYRTEVPAPGREVDVRWSWTREVVPMPAPADTAGVASVAEGPGGSWAAGGGDVVAREAPQETLALERSGAWVLAVAPPMPAAIFGLAWARGDLFAVGPGGLALSTDGASSWSVLRSEAFWAVGFAPGGDVGWAVGPEGRIARIARAERRQP